MKQERSHTRFFRWSILLGLGLSTAAWYPFSVNPGVVGKFLGLYFLGGCLSLWVLSRVLAGTLTIAGDRTTLLLILAIVTLVGLSALASQSSLTILGSSKHHEGLITFLFYGLAYLVAADKENLIDIGTLGAILSMSSIMSLLIGNTAVERSFSLGFGNRFTGSFGEPNFLAGFLVLSIPIMASGVILTKSIPSKLLGIGGLSAALIQIFMSQARTGYLALGASMLAFCLIAWRKDESRFRWAYLLLPALLLPWGVFSRRFSLASLQTGAVDRFQTWLSISETWRYAFIGPGPDRFQFATQNRHGVIGPHNTFINYAGNIGWLAVSAYAVLILFALVRLIKMIRQSPWSESISTSLLFASLFGYSVFSFFSYTRSYVNIIFWVLLGLAASLSTDRRGWKLPAFSRFVGSTTLILTIALVAVTLMQMVVGGYHYWQAGRASSEAQAWTHVTSAIRYEPTELDYRIKRGQMAWEYMNKELSGTPVGLDFSYAGVEDYEFIFGQARNDENSYLYLNTFYIFANVPKEEWLAPPDGYDLENIYERLAN